MHASLNTAVKRILQRPSMTDRSRLCTPVGWCSKNAARPFEVQNVNLRRRCFLWGLDWNVCRGEQSLGTPPGIAAASRRAVCPQWPRVKGQRGVVGRHQRTGCRSLCRGRAPHLLDSVFGLPAAEAGWSLATAAAKRPIWYTSWLLA